jgi:hypothetical protein
MMNNVCGGAASLTNSAPKLELTHQHDIHSTRDRTPKQTILILEVLERLIQCFERMSYSMKFGHDPAHARSPFATTVRYL